MTKDDFEKEKETQALLLKDDIIGVVEYFSALSTLQNEYIESLENKFEVIEQKFEIATDILFDCHGSETYYNRLREAGLYEDEDDGE